MRIVSIMDMRVLVSIHAGPTIGIVVGTRPSELDQQTPLKLRRTKKENIKNLEMSDFVMA
ncbi:hypothetical protein AOQ84DRAFT_94006 [Glonium stellatum]|uniref:Uncharacterized protein n=1 Tax=Glonium stellatum TaxID=574774 RepID=A0A8E2JQS4_9PEZI|nr:hypothetical protein AOQ84DRAFT_94006 [Glonium stellatum]